MTVQKISAKIENLNTERDCSTLPSLLTYGICLSFKSIIKIVMKLFSEFAHSAQRVSS